MLFSEIAVFLKTWLILVALKMIVGVVSFVSMLCFSDFLKRNVELVVWFVCLVLSCVARLSCGLEKLEANVGEG